MKHLKKKFVHAPKLGDEVVELLNDIPVTTVPESEIDNNFVFGLTKTGYMISMFKYTDKENNLHFVPQLDLVVLYFETARMYGRHIDKYRQKTLKYLNQPDEFISPFYSTYSTVMICVTNLFNSLEAAINRTIPDNYIYQDSQSGKPGVTHYNKADIEKALSFEKKVKSVLPNATGKNFASDFGSKYETIKNLKILRDEITHAKTYSNNSPTLYESLYNGILNFQPEPAQKAVMDFINFYHDNLIEECNCGKGDDPI